MKHFLPLLALLFAFAALDSKACIEYHPDSIIVNVAADTLCNFELRITNLRLGAGNAGQFCSCGIGNSIPVGVTIDYIIFVDSITGLPIPGFNGFDFLASAGVSWEDVDPQTFNWAGFVSDVNESGLMQNHAVDLVIRGQKTTIGCIYELLGYNPFEGDTTFFPSVLQGLAFGTDEWNPSGDALMLSHNDITYLTDVPAENWRYFKVPATYFTDLDNLLNSVIENPTPTVSLFPNPASDTFTISGLKAGSVITLFHPDGRTLRTIRASQSTAQIDLSGISGGLYLVVIQTEAVSVIKRLVVR